MPSIYLQPGDYAAWGVPEANSSQVQRASTLVDAYLERPEGLIYATDAAGAPAYMAALAPASALGAWTIGGAISPGRNVVVPFQAATLGLPDLIGEVLVLDRDDADRCEAVAITGMDQQAGTVTLDRVAFPHSSGTTAETGLCIVEERSMPSKRSVTRASRSPIARLIAGVGRCSYGRRSDQVAGAFADVNLLSMGAAFGPPAWLPFDVTQASISVATNEIWVPASIMAAYYSEVRIRYVAGFPAGAVPNVVKKATADIVGKFANFSDADPMFKIVQAGGTRLERWTESNLDTDTKALLEPFRLKLLF